LVYQPGTGGQEIDDSPEHNDQDKAQGGVDDEALALLFGLVVSSTEDEVFEYTPHQYQESDTEDERDKDIVRENEDILQ